MGKISLKTSAARRGRGTCIPSAARRGEGYMYQGGGEVHVSPEGEGYMYPLLEQIRKVTNCLTMGLLLMFNVFEVDLATCFGHIYSSS